VHKDKYFYLITKDICEYFRSINRNKVIRKMQEQEFNKRMFEEISQQPE